jgi:exosortase H (IPTLxxWG-CTERM-specific)
LRPAPPATASALKSAKQPVRRFVGLFVLFLAAFYAVLSIPWVRLDAYPVLLELNADVAAAILSGLGESARSSGVMVISPRSQLSIMRGCDAVDPAMLFLAAVLAFPAPIRAKLLAIAIGLPVLLAANLIRIISLYYVGVHFPGAFEIVHVDVWQALFIMLTMIVWIIWAARATPLPAKVVDARP